MNIPAAGCSKQSLIHLGAKLTVLAITFSCLAVHAQQTFLALSEKSGLTAINNSGQAVGWRAESNGTRSIISFNGTTQVVATSDDSYFSQDGAIDINDQGGVLYYAYPQYYYKPAAGAAVTVGALGEGSTTPVAVNSSSLVAGNYYLHEPGRTWQYGYTISTAQCPPTGEYGNTNVQQLPNWKVYNPSAGFDPDMVYIRPGYSYANGINDSGTVAGFCSYWPSETDNRYQKVAAYWTGTTLHKMGTLGYSTSEATAINNNGDIAGVLYNAAAPFDQNYGIDGSIAHAFLYSGQTMLELTNFNEKPLAINDLGVILSATSFYDDGVVTQIQTLLPAGWTLGAASDINNSNQVVGYATGPDGLQHGFILQVPEPTTLCLMSLGGAAMMRRRNGKH